MSAAEEEPAGAALARRGWGLLVGERPRRVSAALGFLAIDFEILGLCRHWGDWVLWEKDEHGGSRGSVRQDLLLLRLIYRADLVREKNIVS